MSQADYYKQLKSQPETALVGAKWSQEEEAKLLNELGIGLDIDTIAKEHKRMTGGIQSRMRQIAVRMIKSGKSIDETCVSMRMTREELEDALHRHDGKEKKNDEKKVMNCTDSLDKIAKDHKKLNDILAKLDHEKNNNIKMDKHIADLRRVLEKTHEDHQHERKLFERYIAVLERNQR